MRNGILVRCSARGFGGLSERRGVGGRHAGEAVTRPASVLVATLLALGCILVLPTGAHAAPEWYVDNARGRLVGAIVQTDRAYAYVHHVDRGEVGTVSFMDDLWVVGFDGPPYLVSMKRTGKSVWSVCRQTSSSAPYAGRAKRAGKRWILQKRVRGQWKTKGKVYGGTRPGKCPGQFAAGALRLLLW